jgi:hypothetical protein
VLPPCWLMHHCCLGMHCQHPHASPPWVSSHQTPSQGLACPSP